jgi:hypothetical protein
VASRPSRSKKPKQPAWEVYRLKGSPAAFVGRLKGSPTAYVGVVYAEDEEGAIAVGQTGRSVAAICAAARMTTRRFPPPWTVDETDACSATTAGGRSPAGAFIRGSFAPG